MKTQEYTVLRPLSADEQLDHARADEAERLWLLEPSVPRQDRRISLIAARLAREGWTPPDPLQAEVEKIEFKHCVDLFVMRDVIRIALERGIEIGRGQ